MKILQICPIFSSRPKEVGSGVTQVVYNISKELSKRGHEVKVYTSNALDVKRKMSNEGSSVIVDGIKVNFFPYKVHYYTFFLTPSMISAVRRNLKEFDIIHIHDLRAFQSIVVYYYARKYGVPYVLQVHGSLPRIMAKQRLKWIYDFFFGYRLLKDASKVIALSQIEAEQYKRMGVPEEKIAIIPNGIDLSEYANLPPKGCFKKKFGIKEEKKTVLYLGRIHKIKGIDILVRTFANVVKKLDDVRLVIVGPDDGYLSELEALIKALKIEDKVLITEPLYDRDKLEAYVDADLYVLPSRYETFPMTILEAYACGKPVIASKLDGLKDLVINRKTGLLIAPGNAEQLAKSIFSVLNDHDKAEEMGLRGRQFMKENFTITKVVNRLEDLYKEVVSSQPSGLQKQQLTC